MPPTSASARLRQYGRVARANHLRLAILALGAGFL